MHIPFNSVVEGEHFYEGEIAGSALVLEFLFVKVASYIRQDREAQTVVDNADIVVLRRVANPHVNEWSMA